MTQRERGVVSGLIVLHVLALGVLAGIVFERIRFDRVRSGILARLEDAVRARRTELMALEGQASNGTRGAAASLDERLAAVDAALARGDVAGAERAWRQAYTAAVRTRGWYAYAEIGDAAVRIGDAAGDHAPYVARARESYLAALVRARADGSADGVTRACDAFAALGDRAVAEQCGIIRDAVRSRDRRHAVDAISPPGPVAAEADAPRIEP
jgi:hypothetical protein